MRREMLKVMLEQAYCAGWTDSALRGFPMGGMQDPPPPTYEQLEAKAVARLLALWLDGDRTLTGQLVDLGDGQVQSVGDLVASGRFRLCPHCHSYVEVGADHGCHRPSMSATESATETR